MEGQRASHARLRMRRRPLRPARALDCRRFECVLLPRTQAGARRRYPHRRDRDDAREGRLTAATRPQMYIEENGAGYSPAPFFVFPCVTMRKNFAAVAYERFSPEFTTLLD